MKAPWLRAPTNGPLLPKLRQGQHLKRISNAARITWTLHLVTKLWSGGGVRKRGGCGGAGLRGRSVSSPCSLLLIYSGPIWLIGNSRSRLAMLSNRVVAQTGFKYLRHTQAAIHHAIEHALRGGLTVVDFP